MSEKGSMPTIGDTSTAPGISVETSATNGKKSDANPTVIRLTFVIDSNKGQVSYIKGLDIPRV